MRQAGLPAFWGVPIGVYRMIGDEMNIYSASFSDSSPVFNDGSFVEVDRVLQSPEHGTHPAP
jgi:hypothetical protein